MSRCVFIRTYVMYVFKKNSVFGTSYFVIEAAFFRCRTDLRAISRTITRVLPYTLYDVDEYNIIMHDYFTIVYVLYYIRNKLFRHGKLYFC